jgi:hypothetical protein
LPSPGSLALTVPTVTIGRNYQTRSAGVKGWVLVRLHSGEEAMDVNFCPDAEPRTVRRC